MMKTGSDTQRVFYMVDKAFWESGLGAALGPHAVMALMALARYLGRDQKCWPSQKTLAKAMGVSAQVANGYISSLLSFRLLDGTPLVTAVKRPTGRSGQARLEYRFNPICQVTNGIDPPPIDPALVPNPKKKQSNPENLEKARQAKEARRRAATTTTAPG